jgi:hypothetical protein
VAGGGRNVQFLGEKVNQSNEETGPVALSPLDLFSRPFPSSPPKDFVKISRWGQASKTRKCHGNESSPGPRVPSELRKASDCREGKEAEARQGNCRTRAYSRTRARSASPSTSGAPLRQVLRARLRRAARRSARGKSWRRLSRKGAPDRRPSARTLRVSLRSERQRTRASLASRSARSAGGLRRTPRRSIP